MLVVIVFFQLVDWTLPVSTRGKPHSGTVNEQVTSLNQKENPLVIDLQTLTLSTLFTSYPLYVSSQGERRVGIVPSLNSRVVLKWVLIKKDTMYDPFPDLYYYNRN